MDTGLAPDTNCQADRDWQDGRNGVVALVVTEVAVVVTGSEG